jgi:hypothetical protein
MAGQALHQARGNGKDVDAKPISVSGQRNPDNPESRSFAFEWSFASRMPPLTCSARVHDTTCRSNLARTFFLRLSDDPDQLMKPLFLSGEEFWTVRRRSMAQAEIQGKRLFLSRVRSASPVG